MMKNNEIRHASDHILKAEWQAILSKSVLMFLLMIVIQVIYNAFLFVVAVSLIGVFDNLFLQALGGIAMFLLASLPRVFINMGFNWNFLNLATEAAFDVRTFFEPLMSHPVRNLIVTLFRELIVSLPVFVGYLLIASIGGPIVILNGQLETSIYSFGIATIFIITVAIAMTLLLIWLNVIMAFTDFVLKDRVDSGTFAVIRSAFETIKGHVLKYIGLQIILMLQLFGGLLLGLGLLMLITVPLANIVEWLSVIIGIIGSILLVVFAFAMMIRFNIIDAVFYRAAATENRND